MNKKELFKNAHKMTKKIKRFNKEINYKFQFSLCLKFLISEERREEIMKKARLKIDFHSAFISHDKLNEQIKKVRQLSVKDIIVGIIKKENDATVESGILYYSKICSYTNSDIIIKEMIDNLKENILEIMFNFNCSFLYVARVLVDMIKSRHNYLIGVRYGDTKYSKKF